VSDYTLSIIIPYYNQPEMLAKQIEYWRDWPDKTEIVVVDDGSKKEAIDLRFDWKQVI